MPKYEYMCMECGESETVDHVEDLPELCFWCLSMDTFRRVYSFGVQFKGNGFYSTGG